MKKIFYLFFFIAAGSQLGYSQSAKSIYFEIGGPGIVSFNYDMRFSGGEKGLGGRIGFGGADTGDDGVVFIPVGLNLLLGKDSKHYFEIGAGVTPVFNSEAASDNDSVFSDTFGHLLFGYRLQPQNGGFTFRAFINPIFGNGYFIPYYAGLSFGYKF
jgi:hypothetical protein